MCDPQVAMTFRTTLGLGAALLLGACEATTAGGGPARTPAPVAASPALAMIAGAGQGSLGVVDDASLGGSVEINVLNAYYAASARTCKRVAIRRMADGALFSRVACAGPDGWYWSAASLT